MKFRHLQILVLSKVENSFDKFSYAELDFVKLISKSIIHIQNIVKDLD